MKIIVYGLVLILIYDLLRVPSGTAQTAAGIPSKVMAHILDPNRPLVPDPPGWGPTVQKPSQLPWWYYLLPGSP